MTVGLETTAAVLAATKNDAAHRLIELGLGSADRAVQCCAVRAAFARRATPLLLAVLRRWPTLYDRWKTIIDEHLPRLSPGIREAIAAGDDELRRHGFAAALAAREYEAFPALIGLCEERQGGHGEAAAATLMELAELLYEEVSAPRDYRKRRDPTRLRVFVVSAFEAAVKRIEPHSRPEIIEAFLLLAPAENFLLRRILQTPHERAFVPITNVLVHSQREGVMRLIAKYLDDPHPLSAMAGVISRRKDTMFLRYFLKRFDEPLPEAARANLKKIDTFAWLKDGLKVLKALQDVEQRNALRLVLASGVLRAARFEFIKYLQAHGGPLARREAVLACAEWQGTDANEIILTALDDAAPEVVAAAATLIRSRGLPNAVSRLMNLVVHPNESVRAAARCALSEFRVDRYLASFDVMDDATRAGTGRLVRDVDPECLPALRRELASPSRMKRLRAVRAVRMMDVALELIDDLVKLVRDDDHFVRGDLARALATCPHPIAREAVEELAADRSPSVREAAQAALDGVVLEPLADDLAAEELAQDLPATFASETTAT